MTPTRWVSLREAATFLSITPKALTKRLQRAARVGPDGITEAEIDGVTARKLNHSWRVRFSRGWLDDDPRNPKPEG